MICYLRSFIPVLVIIFIFIACTEIPHDSEPLTLVVTSQALIKIDPRLS
jgi:hypothetical protein